MDEYEQELMNRQSVAKERVMRTAYTGTTDVVGVFKVESCGTYKELTLYLDAEDTRQNSKIEGYVGDTFVDNNGNVRFKFCLTEATQYYPGGVFLVDHINYSQFGGTMDILVRYHDCDDKHTDNKIIDILLDPSTPELILNKEVTDFFDFDNSKELSDVKLVKYKHMGKIPMPIAQ